VLWFLIPGCWPDIRGPAYEPFDTAAVAAAPKVTSEPEGGGITRTVVDATSADNWVFVDVDSAMAELEEHGEGWDLGFSRQRIKLNGGVSGEDGVEVSWVEAPALEDLEEVPTAGFVSDLADDDDENSEPEYAFDVWFDYDSESHVLTPRDYVFVVHSGEGGFVSIEILDYYDEAGTSGIFEIRWEPLQ
jgi:hypothetical protein